MILLTFKNKNFSEIADLLRGDYQIELRPDLNDISYDELTELLKISNRFLISAGNDIELFDDFILNAVSNEVQYVDLPYNSNLLKDFDRKRSKLIVSYHNFERTPYEFALQEIIMKINSYKPDYIKIVTKANKKADVQRLFQLYSFQKNLIAFALGDNVRFSRLTSYYLGSPFIYAAIDDNNKTAEGQLTKSEVESIINICG